VTGTPTERPLTTAVVLAYGTEPVLEECVRALLDSDGADVEVVLVDNGGDPESVARVARLPGVTLLSPPQNLGYAGGCLKGASFARGDVLVFVNSDAVVAPTCVANLVDAVSEEGVGLVSGSVRLAADPQRMNSAGNPVHYLFFSWAGAFGDPATEHQQSRDVASISGATFAVRRAVWEQIGGFDPAYFAYGEDVDLSWRAWQRGYRVRFEPAAVSVHHYDFARNPHKFYLLERNRLINLLTLPSDRTLLRLMPVGVLVEVGLLVAAARDGWARQKWGGWCWLGRHRTYLRQRRRAVQQNRQRSDSQLAPLWETRLEPPAQMGVSAPRAVSRLLEMYWDRWVMPTLERPATRTEPRHG
jgi:GT2 family glycosyltransferase